LGGVSLVSFGVLVAVLVVGPMGMIARFLCVAILLFSAWVLAKLVTLFLRPRRDTIILTSEGISQPYAASSPTITWGEVATLEDTTLAGIVMTSRTSPTRIRIAIDLAGIDRLLREICRRVPSIALRVPTELRASAYGDYANVVNAILIAAGCFWVLSQSRLGSKAFLIIFLFIVAEWAFFRELRPSPRRLAISGDILSVETRASSLRIALCDVRRVDLVLLRNALRVMLKLSSGKCVTLPVVQRRKTLALYGFLLTQTQDDGTNAAGTTGLIRSTLWRGVLALAIGVTIATLIRALAR